MIPTIEICIDNGIWVLGKCCVTSRRATTASQIAAACRDWAEAWKRVEMPVYGVYWRHIGDQRWIASDV